MSNFFSDYDESNPRLIAQQLTVETENKVIDILLLIDVSYGHRPCEKNDNTSKV